ncbi:MFS transporter [Massilia endophytica]|uniref:MFS transporter n=1 Tax=Massilia endophytica TaxID=2899220 RepID=UPI001E5A2E43|nr:MFS transporter [Massilia endophytica]UGQ44690.1 MFS transporter [Massilia endophytica]
MLLLTLAIGFVMAMLDVTAVNTALSNIAADLHVPLDGLVWVLDGYTLSFAALLLAGGALADRYGPKAVYQGGLAVFLLGSVCCALAPSGDALIGARLLQGCGAALFMPSSLSLLTHAAPGDGERARMVAAWSAIVGCAAASGPLVGGLLVQAFGWRSVFWINLPIGLAGIVLAQLRVAAPAATRRPIPIAGHALGMAALASLSYLLIEGPVLGWTHPAVLGAAVLAAVLGAAMVLRERRSPQPLVPRALLQRPGFAAAIGTGFLINFGVFGQLFVMSLYLQQAHGASALNTGLWLMPTMVASTITNFAAGRVIDRLGARPPLLGGLGVAAMCAMLLAGSRAATPVWLVMAGCVLLFFAVGLAIPAMTTTVLKAAGRSDANVASAALNANRQIGALVGVAIAGTVLHMAPDWDRRLPLAFGAMALAYALAWAVVYRKIQAPKAGMLQDRSPALGSDS